MLLPVAVERTSQGLETTPPSVAEGKGRLALWAFVVAAKACTSWLECRASCRHRQHTGVLHTAQYMDSGSERCVEQRAASPRTAKWAFRLLKTLVRKKKRKTDRLTADTSWCLARGPREGCSAFWQGSQ